MMASSADTELSCPLWVKFFDAETQLPYFYNVQTHVRAAEDPDPKGELCCISSAFGESSTSDLTVDAEGSATASDVPDTPFWQNHPARLQKEYDPQSKTAYIEGNEEYNIWFGKFENSRFDKKDREPASYRLEPLLDCGWTQADLKGSECSYFCFFFAKGCCTMGPKCKFHHHVPQFPAGERDIVHDIFGRERYKNHRPDMGGVGCFTSEGRSLFIGGLVFDRTQKANALQLVEKQMWEDFGQYGKVEEVRVISNKGIAFVRYEHRAPAEFAKVALDSQALGLAKMISVKWAHDDPNPQAAKKRKAEMLETAGAVLDQRISSLKLSEVEIAGLQLQHCNMKSFTAPYPDTSSSYPPKSDVVGPSTQADTEAASAAIIKEAQAVEEQAALNTNLDRLSAALAKIDAMHCSGHLEAPTPDLDKSSAAAEHSK